MKDLNKIQVVNKNIHEIKQEILLDYSGEFEIVGTLKVGDQIRQTHIRFRNITDFEAYINAFDEGDEEMMQKILFSKVIFIKSILFNLT